MDFRRLEKADKLYRTIKEFDEALSCLECDGGTKYPSIVFEIKFDGPDGREQKQLPMTLSSEFISFIKSEIIKARGSAVAEFNKIFF